MRQIGEDYAPPQIAVLEARVRHLESTAAELAAAVERLTPRGGVRPGGSDGRRGGAPAAAATKEGAETMQVGAIMSPPEVVLDADTPVREAARLLAEARCDSAPVTGDDGELLGILTEGDLLADRLEADHRGYARGLDAPPSRGPHRVGSAMTRVAVTAAEDQDACELCRRMFETRVRCVPVLRAGAVVGLVRRRDVMLLMLRPDADVSADVSAAIGRSAPDAEGLEVSVRDGEVLVAGTADARTRRAIEALEQTVPGVRSIEFVPSGEPGRRGRPDPASSSPRAV
ncbi:CBS domain-containing protein [Streptomonospora wellingtoniae]|uniref:CBS domain-containing protein n=1 Tax=Streptomonospora wellingtoniae TaxID=3075544 RepID=A0ABU2L040_9ACTN|nr:CBS domain-containing protein [Streptomonospora sp. DSM 45055]MDT0304921.1 CBS domain-containing protein [Streptomonospora sp. DSM 45055]